MSNEELAVAAVASLAEVVELGIGRSRARTRHESAWLTLTEVDRAVSDIAVPGAMLAWYQASRPDGGPSQFIDAAINDARQHVAVSPHFAHLRESEGMPGGEGG